ncbi:MAG: serine hydrolase domain-containing protein [Bryobacteraceae bacterium]
MFAALGACLAQGVPITGAAVRGLESFDSAVIDLMTKYKLPGGALALARDGRLVYARGYGYADVEAEQPVLPDALFRIASSSKPITATAILKLIEDGKLTLDTPAFALLNDLSPLPGAAVDSRLSNITIRHLLEHRGGWEGSLFDSVWMPFQVQKAGSFPYPVTCEDTIRYMKGRPLDFDPGSKSVYSNFGYCVLGRVIERVSGISYADFVKRSVLEPTGVRRIELGNTLASQRYASEVSYYSYPGEPMAFSIFGPDGGFVSWPYGGFFVEGFDSFAGLVANTPELLRFVTSSNGTRLPGPLKAPPSGFVGYVPPTGPGFLWYFQGSVPGSRSMMAVLPDRGAFAILFNSRPPLAQNVPNNDYQLTDEILSKIVGVYRSISAWPSEDLWPEYSPDVIIKRFLHGASFTASTVAPESWVTLTGTNLAVAPLPASTVPFRPNWATHE